MCVPSKFCTQSEVCNTVSKYRKAIPILYEPVLGSTTERSYKRE